MPKQQKIKVAIVGLGHWGSNLVRAFQSDDRILQVVGVEINLERRKFISQKNPKLLIFSCLDECLKDNSIDAFVIATPTETHYALGLKCLEANKHLFVEKPLSDSSKSARHLVDLANKNKRVLMTGHIFLYNQAVRQMKQLIHQGKIGDVLHIKSIRSNLGPIRSDVNALWDLAAHDLSIFDCIFNKNPIKVSCHAFSPLGLQQQDIAIGTLEYSPTQTATFFVSWLDPVKIRQVTVIGDQKMLVFDDMKQDNPLTIYDKRVKLMSSKDNLNSIKGAKSPIEFHVGDTYSVPINKTEPLTEECRDFINCIFSRQNPQSDGKNGLRIVSQLEALVKSYSQNGASIKL
ncbi:MAG: Gfo/Idh/MocA family protein [Pleurocapsa sp.]